MTFLPELTSSCKNGVHLRVDAGARERGVLVAFSDRRGGTSAPPYDALNLALRVGDERDAVERNRMLVARAAGFDPRRLALARQVHGANLIEVGPDDVGVLGEADGLVARGPGPVLGILTADCAPVILAGAEGVAIVHAGWRGVVAGVVEAGLDAVGSIWGAWVGPSVHDCCYEVGPEVSAAFESRGLPLPTPNRVDPGRAAAEVLRRAGVEAVFVSEECTHCHAEHFSHRRDGVTGRQGAFVTLVDPG